MRFYDASPPSIGGRIFQLRTGQTPRLTQRELAERASVSVDLIQKLEQGRKTSARLPTLTAIATALGVDLPTMLSSKDQAPIAGPANATSEVDRRILVRRGVKAASGLAAVAGIDLGGLDRRIHAADVHRLRRVVTRLRALDQEHGAADLWDVAADRVEGIAALLEHANYDPKVGTELVELTGRAYICAGWLATDAGKNDLAHGFYTEALSYADQAGSPEIRVHALLNLALHAQILRHPRQMLRYLDAGERALPPTPPGGVPALALMRRGRALAMLGEPAAAARAFGAAHESLDRDDGPLASWLPWFGHAEIYALEGDAAVNLGQPARGAHLLEQSLAAYDTRYVRNRCLHMVRLGKARASAGELDGAAESAGAVLDMLDGEVASGRIGAELRALADQMQPHRQVPTVAKMLERYQAHATRRDDLV